MRVFTSTHIHRVQVLNEWFDEYKNDAYHILYPSQSQDFKKIENFKGFYVKILQQKCRY